MPIKVLLVEDSLRLRGLLAGMLRELEQVEIIGEVSDEASALQLLTAERADLAIVDLELQSGSGLGLLKTVFEQPMRFGHVRAVVFSNHDHPHLREHCRRLGADNFFNKARQLNDLIDFLLAFRPAA